MKLQLFDNPFRHWVIDELLPAEMVPAAFSQVQDCEWEVSYDNDCERGKKTCRFGLPPDIQRIIDKMNSQEMVAALSRWTGIDGLVRDDAMHGAGLHLIDPHGFLQIHGDYELHPKFPGMERRLNLILFLNPQWRPGWGGELLLCDSMGCAVETYAPSEGRIVLFESGNASFHGVRCVAASAPSRATIAVYYLAPARQSAHRKRAMFFPNRRGGVPTEVA